MMLILRLNKDPLACPNCILLELATVTVVVYGPLHFSLMAGDIFATKEAHFDFSGLPCHTRMDLRVHNITNDDDVLRY